MEALWILAFVLFCLRVESSVDSHKLIVVLVDGFRWDYFNQPGLKLKGYPRFVKHGVRAPYINPVYPSLSYPNINSFATGLYPENHGFVENYLWDKNTDEIFQMIPQENSTDPLWWNEAEPLWITAEKHKKHAALYWWAGCEVKIQGEHPTICERIRYEPATKEGKNDFLERIDDVVELFKPSSKLISERLDLAMFYNSWVDHAGHYNGIDSKEMKLSIQYIDDILDYLLTSLKKTHLDNKVNVIVLADHGMQDVTNSTYITLDKYADDIKYQVNTGPTSTLIPLNDTEDKLYNDIKKDNIQGLHVYRVKDIPESFHTKHAHRIGPIVLETDPHYFIKGLTNSSKRMGDTYFEYYGEHGYNPENNTDMKAFFLAIGPDFKSGYQTKPFDIIDLYNVMCRILKIEPLPNNGTWEHVQPMLRTAADGPFHSEASLTHAENLYIISYSVLFIYILLNKSRIIV